MRLLADDTSRYKEVKPACLQPIKCNKARFTELQKVNTNKRTDAETIEQTGNYWYWADNEICQYNIYFSKLFTTTVGW